MGPSQHGMARPQVADRRTASNMEGINEEKSDCSKDSYYDELEQVLNHFPKYEILMQNWEERGYFQTDNCE